MTCCQSLTDEERAQLQGWLKDAENAYHQLQIGGGVAEFSDQNNERVVYRAANRVSLIAYINQLRGRLGLDPMCGVVSRPMGFIL